MKNDLVRKIDVIIPVYKGLDETVACILSAVQSLDTSMAQMVIINDASPETALVEWLIAAEREYGFVLLHNKLNLGFVATVNRGMQLHADRDVLLLNSDVEVYGDWLIRMRDGAYGRERVASVTPFSNNAVICSFPNFCQDNKLLFDLPVKEIDGHFADAFCSTDLAEVPTGVGFCMYIRRDCLDEVGYFDAKTFGKGYGEENDWCQRADKAGWKNYHLANVFVYHKGGVSFDAEQEPRKATALRLLTLKHPDYEDKVQAFIREDPARKFRIKALWTLFARSSLPKVLLVTHRLGGGVAQHLNELVKFYSGLAMFIQLAPIEDGVSVGLSIFDNDERLQDGLSYQVEGEYEKLVNLLRGLGIGRVHFHHTIGLHPRIWALPGDLDCGFDLSIHDYYLVNGNPTLTGEDGRFVGFSRGDEFDKACAAAYPIPVTADQWRDNVSVLVEGADRVIFPSADACQRFNEFFTIEKPMVAWHPDFEASTSYSGPRFTYPGDRPLRVLVLGAVSREKGADILETVANQLEDELVEFHLLGYAYRQLSRQVRVHGPYENSEAIKLLNTIAPDVIWYPAVCPETYSYTLSLAFESGLPVVVPDLGAFPERVFGRPCSVVMPWDTTAEKWADFWRAVRDTRILPTSYTEGKGFWSCRQDDFYATNYLSKVAMRDGDTGAVVARELVDHYARQDGRLTTSDRVKRLIWSFSRLPVISFMIGRLPPALRSGIKDRIKKGVSRRPMHEILNRDRYE